VGFTDISITDKANPDVELSTAAKETGAAKIFSARITAVKP
jgi:hypothetical protein